MKHSAPITLIMLALFLVAQYLGLGIISFYIDPVESQVQGDVVFRDLPIGERPPLEQNTSYIPIILSVLIGTVILLLLIKFRLGVVWKGWFLLSVVISLTVAFGAVLPAVIAIGLAIILGIWKIFFPNVWVHNGTELFLYGGLAAIFVPVLNLFSVSILLVLIAIYDAYAVWKSKHMVALAQAQTKQKVFAGLFIPYGKEGLRKGGFKQQEQSMSHSISQSRVAAKAAMQGKTMKQAKTVHPVLAGDAPTGQTAILGGGDIAFPLLFAGVILKEMGLWQSLIIPIFALLALGLLLWYGKQNRFYPAMPFISAGCFVGFGVVWLISSVL